MRLLGLDETRARSLRWSWTGEAGWRLGNRWMTSFVDLDLGRPGWLLGLVPGRSETAVQTWLAAQPEAWRAGIAVVAVVLLAAGDRLSSSGRRRLARVLRTDDPTNEISAAWAVKERLRHLLAAPTPHDAHHRLFRFYDAVLAVDLPEATRLADTVQTWWPAIEAFLRLHVTNARTEGANG